MPDACDDNEICSLSFENSIVTIRCTCKFEAEKNARCQPSMTPSMTPSKTPSSHARCAENCGSALTHR